MKNLQDLFSELSDVQKWKDSTAADAVEVVMIFSVPNSSVAVLKVDDRFVARNKDGEAKIRLRPGTHRMEWRAYGPPDTEYRVGITVPDRLKWEPNPPKRTDGRGFAANEREFTV